MTYHCHRLLLFLECEFLESFVGNYLSIQNNAWLIHAKCKAFYFYLYFMYFFNTQTDVRHAACARLSREPTKRLVLGWGECSSVSSQCRSCLHRFIGRRQSQLLQCSKIDCSAALQLLCVKSKTKLEQQRCYGVEGELG